ncbi:hypothetical protein [Paractinoplanes toevensis]|uniref:Uncharacterized protein n=1 Tax=Paractinoplanes toevensis TaxID=571911 RepID=A0A919W1U7_9ACTN|nr:hypothetical protein [Actinoplanes toevensis]GIM88820.1 hypothetical protein Ato02nite_006130 [Actinoplanes toevensis]
MSDTRPAIRLIDYMSSDSLDFTNIIGPYGSVEARNRELVRLELLPLGAPEFYGGQQYAPATMADAVGELCWSLRIGNPAEVAKATTQRGVHHALHGWDDEDEDAEPDPYEPHPDQIGLFS